jgi:hypothetical protein
MTFAIGTSLAPVRSSLVSVCAFAEVYRASDACVGWSRPTNLGTGCLMVGYLEGATFAGGICRMPEGSEPHGTFQAN